MEPHIKLDNQEVSLNYQPLETSQVGILVRYIFITIPRAKKLLETWEKKAQAIPDINLRQQALASIKHKAFHCQGGAVYAVPYPQSESQLLQLITAYQTICDYLDNLCDRAGSTDGDAFLLLHQSLIDALTPGNIPKDYYARYSIHEDGGYLQELVRKCQSCVEVLPSYQVVYPDIMRLADLYIQLQVKKHLALDIREQELKQWVQENLPQYPGILWQEFAAASGSTLALFALFGLATCENIDEKQCQQVVKAYFPWICGLHILLDYFIDQQEDCEGGDLNFTFYYESTEQMLDRLKLFIQEAHRCADLLPSSTFDKTIVEGLLAAYLSDNKVSQQGYRPIAHDLLDTSGPSAVRTYRLCSAVRKFL
ncbi:MAG: tetraprenyl-beta-curcumene synthase family protein [Syntrophomonadaceae bacterium]|nr:tetraprenyl-beta-curcumene synthase family protein [Syntrophomonadaceae bacterium]